MLDTIRDAVTRFATNRRAQSRDLPGVMIVLIIAGVVGFVGLQVMSTVIDSTALGSNDSLYNASQDLVDAVNQAFSLVGVAFIVIILSVVILYLYGLRGR